MMNYEASTNPMEMMAQPLAVWCASTTYSLRGPFNWRTQTQTPPGWNESDVAAQMVVGPRQSCTTGEMRDSASNPQLR